ncbi:DNA translocase FtsK [Microvirga vignae]|uniref:DNA translocase FtsK n=1 Tax=Microvirga vignae TaxID=1225564 RepID=UPI003CC7A9EE
MGESIEEPASAPAMTEGMGDVATASVADSAALPESLETSLNPVGSASVEPATDSCGIEEAAPERRTELLLPVPVETARPVFSAFAFQSSLYRITVSLKPELSIDLSMEDPVPDDSVTVEEKAEFIQIQEVPENGSELIGPEEEIAPEVMEVTPEQTNEEIDSSYLALYGEEVSSSSVSMKVAREVENSPPSSTAVSPVVPGDSVSAAHALIAQVINFPAPERARNSGYELPDIELLAEPPESEGPVLTEDILEERAGRVEKVIRDFGVKGEVIHVHPGPVVTLYELEPAPGVKSSRVIALSEDIARSMSAVSARVAVVPGRNAIGIELPNDTRETVYLREMLETADFKASTQKLPLCLGKTIGGEPVIADLARMPHLLVAGTTGSGKSVAINTMILSLVYRFTPEQCRLIMVDPKMLELSVYDGIPHLLTPVVTDPKKAVIALKWAVREMEDRYRKMSKLGVRNIDGFNARVSEAKARGEVITRTIETGFDRETGKAVYEEVTIDLTPLPYIVVIVDEMADLMMVAGKEIEGAIQRLAQMARAAGIHVILATQRPSVDVITGTIKANFPTRISFQVTSKIDSRTILGEMGAEQLLGQGDMLYMAGGGRITRVHGPFCSDEEVEQVVAHLKRQGRPQYLEAVTADEEEPEEMEASEFSADDDDVGLASSDIYEQAVSIVLRHKKASTSYIQRRLQIGYNRAASLMERMEKEGIVGPSNHAGKREILRGEFED